MITQGRSTRPKDTLLNSRKYKQRGESFTLGNVVNRLNSTTEKMATSNMKKAAILESLHQASRHEIITCEEARDSLFDMKSMRKSLQTQLKNDGQKAMGYEGGRKVSTRKHSGSEPTCSAVFLGRLSSASSRAGIVVKKNEKEKKYCAKEALKIVQENKYYHNERTQSVYSRHMNKVESNFMENQELDFSELGAKNRQSKIGITVQHESPETQCDESKLDLEYSSENQDVFLSVSARENSAKSDANFPQETISSKEKEVLDNLTDPQLKESLQNIIKRRRSSVRFVKSESGNCGYDMSNLDKTLKEQVEETADQYCDQQQEDESESAVEGATNSDTTRSVKSATTRRVSANRQRLSSAATSTSGSLHGEGSSQPRMQRPRKTGRQEQNISPTRRVSSARSCASVASQRSLSSPILRRRKPELQTGETRVIRPATAKGYVPNVTYRKNPRKQSAMSSPDILMQKEQAKNLAEVKMIREFLLMYAKVTTKNKAEDSNKPVRMMSQTPELVIKSAIGQFLTRAFPSGESREWNGLSAASKKERYEEKQRSKLLRIKICMKHLAAVA